MRNRTFWFADYEGLRDHEGVPRVRQVPTAAEKAGLFSSAVVDPFAAGRPEFSRNAQGQWVIPRDRWDPVGAAIVALIPDPNVAGSTIYASTPVTDTRQDQFDVRIDHQISTNAHALRPLQLRRYADVPAGAAAGPGARARSTTRSATNDNRSQGLALGVTWIVSPTLVGDIRFGFSRGDYFTNPPNFGVDGAAQIGLRNVPNDPAIVGGVPKVNIQGFDAVGRHTSTPQFQTPRSWNPRATFSLNRGAHFVKFGGEFLHVKTRINDLNATDRPDELREPLHQSRGRRPAPRAAVAAGADQLHGHGSGAGHAVLLRPGRLPDLATADGEPRRALRVRDAAASRRTTSSPTSIRSAGTMVFAKDGDTFERALIHPDRNNFAPRIGFAYTPAARWVVRGGYGVFYTHTVRQGREGMLGFNPPYLVDNLLQTGVTGAAAVASAAPFRLVNGYPSGLLDPTTLAPTVAGARRMPISAPRTSSSTTSASSTS